jgi:hypothetical protein
MRTALILFAAMVAGLVMSDRASAQDPNRRPNVSPYLNLLIPDQFGVPGGNPGQYQTLVEPFIQGRQAQQANANALGRLNAQVNGRGRGGGSGGGSNVGRFMNYSHYYSGIRH